MVWASYRLITYAEPVLCCFLDSAKENSDSWRSQLISYTEPALCCFLDCEKGNNDNWGTRVLAAASSYMAANSLGIIVRFARFMGRDFGVCGKVGNGAGMGAVLHISSHPVCYASLGWYIQKPFLHLLSKIWTYVCTSNICSAYVAEKFGSVDLPCFIFSPTIF